MALYLIDGNNLAGKLKNRLPGFGKPNSRKRLAELLGTYFSSKKDTAIVFFDGHEATPLKVPKIQFVYSGSKAADYFIKAAAGKAVSPSTTVVVSSDTEVRNYGKSCSCGVLPSEEFAAQIINTFGQPAGNDEDDAVRALSREEEAFKKLFGA